MHTFAEKQNQPQQKSLANLIKSNALPAAASHEAHSVLHGPTGDVQSEALNTNGLAHDFSRIPVHAPAPLTIQAQLVVNTPGDVYEQEADLLAEQVMRTPEPKLQRGGGEGPECQTEEQSSVEHARVQTKHVGPGASEQMAAPPIVHEVLASSGQPLDGSARAFFEPRFRRDFSQVRVHSGVAAEQSARDMNANAYTVGHSVVFGAGQYSPHTLRGQRLLAHELTHVVQQGGSDGIQVDRSSETRGFSPDHSLQVPGRAEPLLVQRAPAGGASPSAPNPDYLSGVTAVPVPGTNFYTIDLTGEGLTLVGPYRELRNYVLKNNLGLEAHHIIGVEFIEMLNTAYTEATMPAAALRPKGHEPITTRVNAELNYYGGRAGGRVQLTAREIAQIYNEAYTTTTPFLELYRIARNILGTPTAPQKPPSGSPQGAPPTVGGPPATTTKPGTRVTAGAALLILGASYSFNWIIESGNRDRANKEIERFRPSMLKEQSENPTLGFLLVFRFSAGSSGLEGSSASGRFEQLSWRRGYTEQEAQARWNAEARMEPNTTYQFGWVAPLEAPSPAVVATPFAKVGLAKFADISKIEFQRVEFKEWGGFDTDGTDGPVNATKWDDAEGFRFIVLRMPTEVPYRNINREMRRKTVTIQNQGVIGGVVPALMLDDGIPAITVWPADAKTVKLFAVTHEVGDKEHKLLPLANVNLVRWLNPLQVKLLTKF